jgi:hypothetical protein
MLSVFPNWGLKGPKLREAGEDTEDELLSIEICGLHQQLGEHRECL